MCGSKRNGKVSRSEKARRCSIKPVRSMHFVPQIERGKRDSFFTHLNHRVPYLSYTGVPVRCVQLHTVAREQVGSVFHDSFVQRQNLHFLRSSDAHVKDRTCMSPSAMGAGRDREPERHRYRLFVRIRFFVECPKGILERCRLFAAANEKCETSCSEELESLYSGRKTFLLRHPVV